MEDSSTFDSGSNKWCLIESDPGVFTALCRELKVQGVEFKEVYGLDQGSIDALQTDDVSHLSFSRAAWATPDTESASSLASSSAGDVSSSNTASDISPVRVPIYGLIFLFKFYREDDPKALDPLPNTNLFFARQVVQNACATQAILSVLFNHPEIDIGTALECEKAFILSSPDSPQPLSAEKLAERRGEMLGQCDGIRRVHNSFRAESGFELPDTGRGSGEAFHYVSYLPFSGKVYELDGLLKGPVCHGECDMDNWMKTITPEIVQRIEKIQSRSASGMDIRFNLLALVPNKLEKVKAALETRRHVRHAALIKALSFGADVSIDEELNEEAPNNVPTMEELPNDLTKLNELIEECAVAMSALEAMLFQENEKHKAWDDENARRRHDWVPFIINTLELLAKRGELMPAYTSAVERISSSSKMGDNTAADMAVHQAEALRGRSEVRIGEVADTKESENGTNDKESSKKDPKQNDNAESKGSAEAAIDDGEK